MNFGAVQRGLQRPCEPEEALNFSHQNWLCYSQLGFYGGDTNLRRYVGNDPTNETDPTGQMAFALGMTPRDAILSTLGSNGYAIDLGTMKHPDGWNASLYLILRGTGRAKSAAAASPEVNNALGSWTNNKIFYYEAQYPNLLKDMKVDPGKLSKEQRLTIFKANLLRYGRDAKNAIGYEDFKEQGWKEAGLGAVYVQLELQYGNEGLKLLNFALSKGVRIESDNDSFWFTEKEYSNGKIQIAESKRRGLKRATTVEEAAKYLYTLLKDNKENIEEWANRNYNDPTSAAQMSDHMTDPHTGAAMPLHVGGRGGLARGFDDMLTEASSQIRGLMWEYALAGLNVQSSTAARAAQTEREISVMSTPAQKAFQAEGKAGQNAVKAIRVGSRDALEFTRAERARVDILINIRKRLTQSQIDNFRRFLEAEHPQTKLFINGPDVPQFARLKPNELGAFGVLPNGSIYITLSKEATGYVAAHEYLHLVHFRNVQKTYGDQAVAVWNVILTTRDKEQMVYNGLREWWKNLTSDERQHATQYVIRKGGFAGE